MNFLLFNYMFISVVTHHIFSCASSFYIYTRTTALLGALISILTIAWVFIILTLYVYQKTSIRLKISRYEAHKPICLYNALGKIIYRNKAFLMDIDPQSKYLFISNLNVIYPKSFQISSLNQIDNFLIKHQKEGVRSFIHFDVIKHFKWYICVGNDLTLNHLYIEKTFEKAYIEPLSHFSNEAQAALDLSQLTYENPNNKHAFAVMDVLLKKNLEKCFDNHAMRQMMSYVKEKIHEMYKEEITLYHMNNYQIGILIQNQTSVDDIEFMLNQIINALNFPLITKNDVFIFSPKLGVISIDQNHVNDQQNTSYITCAKHALDHAIHNLVHEITWYNESMSIASTHHKRLKEELVRTISNQDFTMHFQPQFHIIKQTIVGVEALIRFNHPDFINESPQSFIDVAQSLDLIYPVGIIALKKTFEAMKALEVYDVHVSLNISPMQLLHINFLDDLIKLATLYDINLNKLCIEITESIFIEDFDRINQVLIKLKALGCNIHLDDFGTHFASLKSLIGLPIDALKIDPSFVKNLHLQKKQQAIIAFIKNLALELSMDVIVEGVEDQSSLNILKSLNIQIIQGFYLSKALPLKDVIKFIETSVSNRK